MNPLKQKEYNLLKDTGHQDLADKVQELVREFNDLKYPILTTWEESLQSVAHRIYNADTPYDAKEILFDYVKKLR